LAQVTKQEDVLAVPVIRRRRRRWRLFHTCDQQQWAHSTAVELR